MGEAVSRTEPLIERIRLVLEQGSLHVQSGRSAQAAETAARARAMIAEYGGDLPPLMYAAFAALDMISMQPPSAVLDGLAGVASRLTGSTEEVRMLLATMAFGSVSTGRSTAAEVAELATRAATGSIPVREGWMLVNYASAALGICDRHDEGMALLDRGTEWSSRLGDVWNYRYLSMLRSHSCWYAGRLVEAEGDARAATPSPAGTR
ncbi:hypothetical protein [Kutzneria sp. 744]|uniref:hypothetical protein n=1 Tax=Kutzneria sp. (strain 744) TaxID=345341 RepID=UPI0003EEC17D|nr:hypothetical protein [Kutzneria sp. 744]EWM18518.1 hypothetical protein KUTG_08822 [Kutzneria sp. 744]